MGNSLRCCIACVLPCGALDLIRIVHLNGYVEEITRTITAGDILRDHPNYVLSKPSSQGVVRRIVILSPDSELKRGGIYFLVPDPATVGKKESKNHGDINRKRRNHRKRSLAKVDDESGVDETDAAEEFFAGIVVVNEKKSSKSSSRHRRSKERLSDWKPELESITEDQWQLS